MKIKSLVLLALGPLLGLTKVPPDFVGDWLLVNGVLILQVDEAGTMTLRNTGNSAPLVLDKDGEFTWSVQGQAQSGRFERDRLYLLNAQPDAPSWIEYLEFRRGTPEEANGMIEHALRQQNQTAAAFEKVRRSSQEKAVLNNLRMLSAAADQYFLENGVSTTTFDKLVGPGTYIKSLRTVDGEEYRNLDFSQGADTWTVTTESGIAVEYNR